MLDITERRSKFVYDAARLAACAATAQIIPASWDEREEPFKRNFAKSLNGNAANNDLARQRNCTAVGCKRILLWDGYTDMNTAEKTRFILTLCPMPIFVSWNATKMPFSLHCAKYPASGFISQKANVSTIGL
jgi:hypothetical protein